MFRLLLGQRIAQHIAFLAPSRTGVGKIGFQVTGPGFSTTKDYAIETRLGWGPVTRVTTQLQQPNETYTPAALLAGLAAGDVALQVSYSPFQGFDPAAIALALSRYPYGCTEQLVSTAYPLLYAAELANDPKLKRGMADAVGKLVDRQTLDGAFGLWRAGDGEADPWLGAYATDFLLEAKAQGAPVPTAAVDSALSAMRQISRPEGFASVAYRLQYPDTWADGKDASKAATVRMRSRASAYALYVLAKGGRGPAPPALVARRADEVRALAAGHGPDRGGAGDDGRPRPRPLGPAPGGGGPGLQGPLLTGTRARCATWPASSPFPMRPANPASPAASRAGWPAR